MCARGYDLHNGTICHLILAGCVRSKAVLLATAEPNVYVRFVYKGALFCWVLLYLIFFCICVQTTTSLTFSDP